MKKSYLGILALAALGFAACTDSESLVDNSVNTNGETPENAINFTTYLGGAKSTRAGATGSINTAKLQEDDYGFGVFAYYTGTQTYQDKTSYTKKTDGTSGQSTLAANFMFNQQVAWDGNLSDAYVTKWTYSPVKYWPNEVQNGAVDDQDNDTGTNPATSTYDNGGNVSFFAYAPYVDAAISSTTDGIVAINGATTLAAANTKAQDPIITYIVPTDGSKMVDLLWGTYNGTSVNVLGGETNTGVAYKSDSESGNAYEQSILPHYTDADKTTTDGYRLNADLTKQKTNGTVGFAFKHALAKVGGSTTTNTSTTADPNGLMVVLDLDDMMGNEVGGTKANSTVVTITDVQIAARALYPVTEGGTTTNQYLKSQQGDLNLATGQWGVLTKENTDANQSNAATTQHNITSDASENSITSSATLNSTLAEPASVTTFDGTNGYLNSTNTLVGVLTTPKNIYEDETNPLVFIPGTYPELTITVNYTVRTFDSNLPASASGGEGTWTRVKQVITKKVTFANPVELNKQYNLLMHLGLTSVKFTATVSDWEIDGTDEDGDGTIEDTEINVTDAYLPINVGGVKYNFTSYSAATDGDVYATGVAQLTGETKDVTSGENTTTYYEIEVLYNTDSNVAAGTKYYIESTAASDETSRYQLYSLSGETLTTTGIYVSISRFEPVTYSFTSYSAASDGTVYATGTAQTTGNFKSISDTMYQQIVVLTNPGYESWVGKTFYVIATATAGNRYQLYDDNGDAVNVWVTITQ